MERKTRKHASILRRSILAGKTTYTFKIGQNGRYLLDRAGHSLGGLKMFSIDENAVTMSSLFADDESNDMSHADLPFDHYH